MNNNKTRELQAQIEQERQKMINCNHNFGSYEYVPYDKFVPYGFKLEAYGSDCYTVPEGYRKESEPRWKRVCLKCGYEQFTEKTETVVAATRTIPKFD